MKLESGLLNAGHFLRQGTGRGTWRRAFALAAICLLSLATSLTCGGKTDDVCAEATAYLVDLKCTSWQQRIPDENSCRTHPVSKCWAGCIVDLRPSCFEMNTIIFPGASDHHAAYWSCYNRCWLTDGGSAR